MFFDNITIEKKLQVSKEIRSTKLYQVRFIKLDIPHGHQGRQVS